MLPKELSDILEDYDPDDFDIVITKVDRDISNSKFDLQLFVQSNTEENHDRIWTISTKQYRKSKISFEYASTLEISQDHPILWQFSDKQSEIYFNGNCKDIDRLYLNLSNVHKGIFQDLLPFDESLNDTTDFYKLMNASNGLLARGPQKLLKQYEEILEQHSLKCSIIGDRVPTYWDGDKHVTESGNAKVLFVDNSYIIADEFEFF